MGITKIPGRQLQAGTVTGNEVQSGSLTLDDIAGSSTITTQGNTFNGANDLVQLDGSSRLPAVDGSLLTGVVAAIPPIATTDLTDVGGVLNGPNGLVELDSSGKLPAIDGSQLTNLPGSGFTIPLVLTGTSDAGPQVLLTLSKQSFGSTLFSEFYGGIDGVSTGLMLSGSGSPTFPSFTFMTTSSFMGIGTATPAYSVDSNGDINTATLFRVAGVPIATTNLSDVGGAVNAANGLVKLDGSGKLPAIDGSQLTNVSGVGITALTNDVSASGNGSVAATVNSVGGASASSVASAVGLVSGATSSNNPSALVKRGASGEFSAGALTLSGSITLNGNIASASATLVSGLEILGANAPDGFVGVQLYLQAGSTPGDTGQTSNTGATITLGNGIAGSTGNVPVGGQLSLSGGNAGTFSTSHTATGGAVVITGGNTTQAGLVPPSLTVDGKGRGDGVIGNITLAAGGATPLLAGTSMGNSVNIMAGHGGGDPGGIGGNVTLLTGYGHVYGSIVFGRYDGVDPVVEVMRISPGSSTVGILTATPGFALDVAGDINTSTAYRVAGTIGWTGTFATGDSRTATVVGGIITNVA